MITLKIQQDVVLIGTKNWNFNENFGNDSEEISNERENLLEKTQKNDQSNKKWLKTDEKRLILWINLMNKHINTNKIIIVWEIKCVTSTKLKKKQLCWFYKFSFQFFSLLFNGLTEWLIN